MASKRGEKTGNSAPTSNGAASISNPTNAWARPLKTSGPPPGMGPADKSRTPAAQQNAAGKKKSQQPKAIKDPTAPISGLHRERMLHLSLILVGQNVIATLDEGTVVEGVFHTFTPFDNIADDVKNKYVLNAVKIVKAGTKCTWKDGSTVILPVEKVIKLSAKNVNLERHNSVGPLGGAGKDGKGDVMTDTQISGSRGGQNRGLVAAGSAWTTGAGSKQSRADALAGALEDSKGSRRGPAGTKTESGLSGSIGGWDQFKANQELFNVKASFDENLYTTQLDKSQIDSRKVAEAERIAKEIENTSSTNIHIAEERGHVVETDYDEEDRYSGVLTKDGKQRHEGARTTKEQQGKMNYAAVAAARTSAETGKAAPPGFTKSADEKKEVAPEKTEGKVNKKAPATKQEPKEAAKQEAEVEKEEKKAETTKEKEDAPKKTENGEDAKTSEEGEADKEDAKKVAKGSKLNANAKAFTFNPAAKSFTPSFGATATTYPSSQQQPQHIADPNIQMQAAMQTPHYVHQTAMGQPGMVPMMNPQYAGMRYAPQYGGIEQHGVSQMQANQPQHMQVPGAGISSSQPQNAMQQPQAAGEGDTSNSEDQNQGAGEQAPPNQQQQHPQQAMPVQYNMPPQGAYFGGAPMGMHARGPGYPPQFVGGPQQVAPYRQMYPMQPGAMPPNMHMRGPGGAPFYPGPGTPMPYPPGGYHGMVEDDGGFRGRGRGSGRGRGRRGGRGGRGAGRGHYQQQPYGHQSGRSTPQNQGPTDDTGNSSIDKPTESAKTETSS